MTGSPPQRRWVLRPAGATGDQAAVLVVQVVGGRVLVDAPRGPLDLDRVEGERVREAPALARAAAVWQRGDW